MQAGGTRVAREVGLPTIAKAGFALLIFETARPGSGGDVTLIMMLIRSADNFMPPLVGDLSRVR
jgi:hypothetical protein